MRLELVGDLTAPGRARAFVRANLGSLVGADPALSEADVVLIASELVTNAVLAGAHDVIVQLTVVDGRLQLAVTDDADGWPALRDPQPDDVHGRGLAMTEALADGWSTTRTGARKAVTATWRLDSRAR